METGWEEFWLDVKSGSSWVKHDTFPASTVCRTWWWGCKSELSVESSRRYHTGCCWPLVCQHTCSFSCHGIHRQDHISWCPSDVVASVSWRFRPSVQCNTPQLRCLAWWSPLCRPQTQLYHSDQCGTGRGEDTELSYWADSYKMVPAPPHQHDLNHFELSDCGCLWLDPYSS